MISKNIEILFEDFETKRKDQRLYFFFFLLRRFFLAILLVQSEEAPLAQSMISIYSSAFICIYTIMSMPFKVKYLNYIEISNEIIVLFLNYLVLCFLVTESNPNMKIEAGKIFVSIICTLISLKLLLIVYKFII